MLKSYPVTKVAVIGAKRLWKGQLCFGLLRGDNNKQIWVIA